MSVKMGNKLCIIVVYFYIIFNLYSMKNLFFIVAMVLGLAINANPLNTNSTSENLTATKSVTELDAFCKLIQQGNFEAVKSMIEAGVNINKKSIGMTPLMFAARQNRVKIVKLLIANGADLNVKSDKGYTALKYAKMSKAWDAYNIISGKLDNSPNL